MSYRISVDTGGTFTDVVLAKHDGELHIGKGLTSKARAFDGIRAGLAVESGLHDFVSDDAALVERVVAESGVTVAIHFAAKKAAGESMTQPGRYFHENVSGSNTLIDALHRSGVDKIVKQVASG